MTFTPDVQQAVRFLGARVRVRAVGDATSGYLAVLEHHGERGDNSPVRRHDADEETFLVLDGDLRVEVDGQAHPWEPARSRFCPAGSRTPSW